MLAEAAAETVTLLSPCQAAAEDRLRQGEEGEGEAVRAAQKTK